ncbi:MAG: SgcJ/EcaC family oxidoreductase [Gammaproteobacteria bacterium]
MPKEHIGSRPALNIDDNAIVQEANDAVAHLVAELQTGWEQHDAEITDGHLAADVAWGNPFGAIVNGYDRLHGIHVKLKEQSKGGSASRFEVERVLVSAPGVTVAHVKRVALKANGQPVEPSSDTSNAFSEMALYVLVRRDGAWWVAAGQNTPVRPGGAV